MYEVEQAGDISAIYENIKKIKEEIKILDNRKIDIMKMIVKERKANGHSSLLDSVYKEIDMTLTEKREELVLECIKINYRPDNVQELYNILQRIEENKEIYPVVDNLINELKQMNGKVNKAIKVIEAFGNKSNQNFNEYVRDIKLVADKSISGLVMTLTRIPEYGRDIKKIEQEIKIELKKRDEIKKASDENKTYRESLIKY